ncbi:MAG: glycosyltransferase family 39 protein [Candidatus Paceibacterota bacterium]
MNHTLTKKMNRTQTKENLFIVLFLLSLITLVVFISTVFFLNLSLRLDEAQSLWQTRQSFVGIINVVSQDVHVPLYHFILHVWQVFLGNDVVTARVLSLLFFVFNIPAFFLLAKLAYNRSVAYLSTLLFSLSPFMNWYGSEIRMYTLFSLLITLNYYFFLSIYKTNARWAWLGYVITAVLGVYTHYFFFFGLATQVIFYFFNQKYFHKKALGHFFLSASIVVVSFLPWGLYVLNQTGSTDMSPLLTTPTSINIFNALTQFAVGFQTDTVNTFLISLWPLSILFVFLGLRKDSRITRESLFFILAIVVPLAIAFVISLVYRPVFLSRYLILALPPFFLVISSLIVSYPKYLSRIFQFLLITLTLVTLGIQGVSSAIPVKEDYRGVTEYISEVSTPRDIVVLSAPFTVYPFDYYYTGLGSVATLPLWDRLRPGPIPSFSRDNIGVEVDRLTANKERLFLLLSYDQGYEDDIRNYFENNYERLERREVSPDLNLYVYRLKYD